MIRSQMLLALVLGSVVLCGCKKEGEAEKAGQKVDQATKDAGAATTDAAKTTEAKK